MVCKSGKPSRQCVLGRYLMRWRLELRRDGSYCETLPWDWCLSLLSVSAITRSSVGPSVPISDDDVQSVWEEDRVFSCPLAPTVTTRNVALSKSKTAARP